MSWNPVEKPYRVIRYFRGRGSAGTGRNYRTAIATYATIEQARADVSANPAGAPKIHFAENAADWIKRGRWRPVK